MKFLKSLSLFLITSAALLTYAQETQVATQVTYPADIFFAASTGNIEMLKRFIEGGADVNATDPTFGASVLTVATATNQLEAAKILLENGADVNQVSPDGSTALHAAALFGFEDLADLLIQKGANIFATGQGGLPVNSTELDWATTLEIASMIQLNITEEEVMEGRSKIREMLEQATVTVAYTKPYVAVMINNQEALKASLEQTGVDLNALDPASGSSILTATTFFADGEIARILLEAGADPNLKNRDGGTPLHAAVFLGKADIVEQLLANGADKNVRNRDGASPLDLADLDLQTTSYIAGMLGIEIDGAALLDARAKIREMLTAE